MESLARREREEPHSAGMLVPVRGVSNDTGVTGLTLKSDVLPPPGTHARKQAAHL